MLVSTLRFQMAMGRKRWFVVIGTALGHCPYGMGPILVGNLNVDLSQTEVRYLNKDPAVMLVLDGLNEMATHFRAQRGQWEFRAWIMVRQHRDGVSQP